MPPTAPVPQMPWSTAPASPPRPGSPGRMPMLGHQRTRHLHIDHFHFDLLPVHYSFSSAFLFHTNFPTGPPGGTDSPASCRRAALHAESWDYFATARSVTLRGAKRASPVMPVDQRWRRGEGRVFRSGLLSAVGRVRGRCLREAFETRSPGPWTIRTIPNTSPFSAIMCRDVAALRLSRRISARRSRRSFRRRIASWAR